MVIRTTYVCGMHIRTLFVRILPYYTVLGSIGCRLPVATLIFSVLR